MTSVLFVCTGNIFRSVTAEFALRRELIRHPDIHVASAGTMNAPGATIRHDVAAYLQTHGLDVSSHRRRTITREIADGSTLIIAMSTDHKEYLAQRYSLSALLFTEACGEEPEPLLDIDDLFSPADRNSPEAQQHIYSVVDQIVAQTPLLARRIIDLHSGPRRRRVP